MDKTSNECICSNTDPSCVNKVSQLSSRKKEKGNLSNTKN